MKHKLTAAAIFMLAGLSLHGEQVCYGSNEAAGKYVEVGDTKLYYETYGQGVPMVLLHGGFGAIGGFQESIPTLSQHFKVYAYDRGGHGRSYDNGKPFGYGDMAEETIKFMDRLNIPEAYIVGYSDGGIIGYHIAAKYPDRVIRLVAVSAELGAENLDPPAEAIRRMLDLEAPAEWVKNMEPNYRDLAPEPNFPAYITRTRDLWTGDSYLSLDAFKTITVPVLLACGDRHDLILEHVLELYRSLPIGQLCILPNCDHFVFENRPALINQIILEFCIKEITKQH